MYHPEDVVLNNTGEMKYDASISKLNSKPPMLAENQGRKPAPVRAAPVIANKKNSVDVLSASRSIMSVDESGISVLPSATFVENNFHTDDGKPMDFSQRPYWRSIYNQARRMVVLLTSRQSEKSTFIAKRLLTNAFMNDNDSALYTTSSIKQVQDFSNKKLRRTFLYNKELAAHYISGRYTVNNVYDKQFSNGSSITLRHSGEDGESTRGNTARSVYLDEKQSINSDAVPVILECAATFPDTSEYIFAGTPLSTDNPLSIDFKKGKQFEWIIKCQSCKAFQEPLGEKHIDPSRPFLFCTRCGKEIFPWHGQWVSFNRTAKYDSYRIVRLMVPFARWRTSASDGILDKLEAYPYYRFLNEVLAIMTESGFKPVTEADLKACCDPPYRMIAMPDLMYTGDVFGGLDWAMEYKDGTASFTKVGFFQIVQGRLKMLYGKTYNTMESNNPDIVMADVINLCNRFNVKILGCDYGVGHKENVRIRQALPDKVFEFQYVNTPKLYPEWDEISLKYTMSRTMSIEEVFKRIKEKWYHFPVWDEFKPFAEDILAEYAEYDSTMRRLRYDHASSNPDDFLHVLNYATWAARLYYGE